jgi:uncharacterized protein (DUF4415 family)
VPASKNDEHIVRYTLEEIKKLGPGLTDWERVNNMTEEELEAAIAADPDSDFPQDGEWELVIPVRKQALSIRLDEDVLNFFRETGPRYQTRINEVLRSYVKHQKAKPKKKA